MTTSENMNSALKTLLDSICKNKKALMPIIKEYELNEGKPGNNSNHKIAYQITLSLKKLDVDRCLSILICQPNKQHKQILLFAIGRYYAPTLKFSNKVIYNDEAAKIDIKNALGYLAYFIFQNDRESCGKISALLQEKHLTKDHSESHEESKSLPEEKNIDVAYSVFQNGRKLSGGGGTQEPLSQREPLRNIPTELCEKSESSLEEKIVSLRSYQKLQQENAKLNSKFNVVRQSQRYLIQEKESLAKENTQLNNQIEKLENTIKYRIQVTSSNVKKTSLCVVEENSSGKYLKRLADLNDGSLTSFKRNKEQRPFFENREELFDKPFQSHEFTVGQIGIWDWTAEPNLNSPAKDYITIHYCPDLCPVEIIDWHMQGLDNVKWMLKHGFQIQYWDMNLSHLLLVSRQDQTYKALYCSSHAIIMEKNNYMLIPNIFYLDEYELTTSDILKTSDAFQRRLFLHRLKMNTPTGRVLLGPIQQTVAHVITTYATNKNLMDLGFSRQSRKSIREFLNSISHDSIYESICNLCHCTLEEAQKSVADFAQHAELYLNGKDESTSVLQLLVERNETMRQQYTSVIEEKWKNKYQEFIKNLEQLQTKLNQINDELETKQSKVDLLNRRLEREENIAEQTRQKVRHKIQDARTDISNFLAELTIYMPQTAIMLHEEKEFSHQFISGIPLKQDKGELIDDINDLTENIAMNLESARVMESYSASLAAYFMAAYDTNMSLILTGPAAVEIADAFSAGLCGHMAARLNCEGEWNPSAAKASMNSDDKVVVVKNLFDGKWMNHFPPMILAAKKLFIFVTPYKEDLAIVPAGIYNYMLPVFTDFFIDASFKKKDKYFGSCWDGSLKEEDSVEANNSTYKILQGLGLYGFMKSKIRRLLNRFQDINISKNRFYSYLYCIVPLFYTLGLTDKIYTRIESIQDFDRDEKEVLLNSLKSKRLNV